jgi:ferrochelatase
MHFLRGTLLSRLEKSACCSSISARPRRTVLLAMRRYLKEFLSDRRVIEVNRRCGGCSSTASFSRRGRRRVGHAYDQIWNREQERIAVEDHHALASRETGGQRLADLPDRQAASSTGACAMACRQRPRRIQALKDQGCDRILLFPLYPQYSPPRPRRRRWTRPTKNVLKAMRWQPAIRVVPPYFDNPAYRGAGHSLDSI